MQCERRSELLRYDVISRARVASRATFCRIYSRNRGYCLTDGGHDAPPVEVKVEEVDEEKDEGENEEEEEEENEKKVEEDGKLLTSCGAPLRRTRFSRGKYSPFSVTSPEGSCILPPSFLSFSLFLPFLPTYLLFTPPLCRQSHLTSLRRKNVGTDPIFPLASQRIVHDLISSPLRSSSPTVPIARSIPVYPIINSRPLVKSTFHSPHCRDFSASRRFCARCLNFD